MGERAHLIETAGARVDQAAKRNNAAKAAIETALFDAVGHTLGLRVTTLLGGTVRDRFPVLWTLAFCDPVQEAERKLEARLYRTLKVKIGAQAPEVDMARMRHLANARAGRAELIVDANQAWDEAASTRCLPQLHEMAVRLVEQPVPSWNLPAMAGLRARPATPLLLADECVFNVHDMLAVGCAGAADAVSRKARQARRSAATETDGSRGRGGGDRAVWRVSAGKLGGCGRASAGFRDASGARLALQAFWPQILVGDLVTEPLRFEEFDIHLPTWPGIGVVLDPNKLRA